MQILQARVVFIPTLGVPGKSLFVCTERDFLPLLMSSFQQPCHKNIAGICSTNLVTAFSSKTAFLAINGNIYCPPHAACFLPSLSYLEWHKCIKQTETRVMPFAPQPQHWAQIWLMDRCSTICGATCFLWICSINSHCFLSRPSTRSIFLLTVYQLKEQKVCQNGGFIGQICLPVCHHE